MLNIFILNLDVKLYNIILHCIRLSQIVVIDQDVFHSQLEKCMVEFPSISILTNEQHKEVGIDSVSA